VRSRGKIAAQAIVKRFAERVADDGMEVEGFIFRLSLIEG